MSYDYVDCNNIFTRVCGWGLEMMGVCKRLDAKLAVELYIAISVTVFKLGWCWHYYFWVAVYV